MDGGRRWRTGWLALATVLLGGSAVRADEHLWCRWSCPRSSYSACNFLTPTVYRAYSYCALHGEMYTYAPNTHPEIPLHYQDVRFRCMQVPPAQYPFPPFELNPRAAPVAPPAPPAEKPKE